MPNLSVLQVVEPGIDGVFRHVEDLTNFLVQEGCKIHIAYSSIRSSSRLVELVSYVERSGGSTVDLRVGNKPSIGDLAAYFKLKQIIKETNCDVIHAHSSKAGFLARLATSKQNRDRCIYTPNAYYGMGNQKNLLRPLYNQIEKTFGATGITINVSPEESRFAQTVLKIPGSRRRLIPNAISFDRYLPVTLETKNQLRKEFNIPTNNIVVGSVGRLDFQKDPITLVDAYSVAAKQNPNLFFAHLGDGRMREDVQARINHLGLSQTFLRIPYLSDVSKYYGLLDIFVLTSRYEGLPFSVLETMAFNLPAVLTSCPGNIGFKEYGFEDLWYGDIENSISIGKQISKAVNRVSDNHKSSNRKIAASHFEQVKVYRRILELYESLKTNMGK